MPTTEENKYDSNDLLDICKKLNKFIEDLNKLLDDTQNDDFVLLLEKEIFSYPFYFHQGLYEIERILLCDSKCKSVEYMLTMRNIKIAFDDLLNKIGRKFSDVINEYQVSLGKEWIDQELIKLAVSHFYAMENETLFCEDKLRNTAELSKNSKKNAVDTLSQIQKYVITILGDISELLKKITPNDNDTYKAVVCYVKEYSGRMYNTIFRSLKKEAQAKKNNRSDRLSYREWGILMGIEEDALNHSINGSLLKNKEQFAYISRQDTMREMEDNYKLMQKILDVSEDEALFNMEYALESHIDILSTLNADNLELFCKMILHHNIIRSETYSDLKPQFDEWINKKSNVEPWVYSLLKYVAPLKEHYNGKDFDGLWNVLISEGSNLNNGNGNIFELKNSKKGTFNRVLVLNIIGEMHKLKMFSYDNAIDLARALRDAKVDINTEKTISAQINFRLKNSPLTKESNDKIVEIIGKYK